MPHSASIDGLLIGQPRRVVEVRPAWRRETILAARWGVYAADHSHAIGATRTAGATLACFVPEVDSTLRDSTREPRLELTFWREAGGSPDAPPIILASFASLAAMPLVEGQSPAPAEFHFAMHRTFTSVDVAGDRPILRVTHGDGACARNGAAAYCHSILPELLALRGGQYRLNEVRLDRALAARFAAPAASAREAI